MINLANIQWGLKGAEELINIHPLFVHFPIGLLLTAVAFYILGCVFKNEGLLAAGKWTLLFGTLAAAVTVWTGLEAEKTVPHGGGSHEIMLIHKYLGFVVVGLSSVLSLSVLISKANIPPKGKIPFLAGLVLLGAILVQSGDLGGRMVFMHGVGVGQKSMLEELTPSAHDHGAHQHEKEAVPEPEPSGHDHGSHAH